MKLNLTNPNKGDIRYSITTFPDGEDHITISDINRKDIVIVECRVTNAKDLFILMQVNDILTRQGVSWILEISYLMSMRMDRVMDFDRPFTLSIVANILKGFSCSKIYILEPHSYRTLELCNAENWGKSNISMIQDMLEIDLPLEELYTVVIPDAGAFTRIDNDYSIVDEDDFVVFHKIRDLKTGKITDIRPLNPDVAINSTKPFFVIDDLCDAGGTFLGIASILRKLNPNCPLNIYVTHMVNEKGIANLSEAYDNVYFTNSYKDWNTVMPFTENIHQYNVI
jgi:ribose-phosphate pyrophosphokinase